MRLSFGVSCAKNGNTSLSSTFFSFPITSVFKTVGVKEI